MAEFSQGSFAQLCEQEAELCKGNDGLGASLNTNNSAFSEFVSRHRLLWLLLFGIVFVSSDQLSKKWAQDNLAIRTLATESVIVDGQVEALPKFRFDPHREIVIFPKVMSFIYRENPAAAFSLTRSFPEWFRRPFLVIISSLASILFLIWYFLMREKDALLLSSLCLIMAGAVGNLIDRATLGYVIDFIDVHAAFLGYPEYHWPTFNIADSCIVVGAILLLISLFRHKKA